MAQAAAGSPEQAAFERAAQGEWTTVFTDPCSGDWTEQWFLDGTALEPDYSPEGIFQPGVPHTIAVIKQERDLFMRVENPDRTYFFHLTNPDLPVITDGRVGLRHMFTRSARYRDFRVSVRGESG